MASKDQREPTGQKFEDFVGKAKQIGAVWFHIEPSSGQFVGHGETQPFRGETGHYDIFLA